MKLLKSVALLSAIVLCGCNSSDYQLDGRIVLNFEDHLNATKDGALELSSFVDSVRFVKLESNNKAFFSCISGLFFVDNKIIIYDLHSHNVLVFNDKGEFVNQISSPGRAKNEYLGIRQCMFDEKNKHIIILENGRNRLVSFDLNGQLVWEKQNFSGTDIIRDITSLPNGGYLCYTFDRTEKHSKQYKDHSGLWEVDGSGNYVRSYLTYHDLFPSVINMDGGYFSQMPDGRVAIRDAYFNDIYMWEKDTVVKQISYDIDRTKLFKNRNKKDKMFNEEPYTLCYSSQFKGNYLFSVWSDDYQERFYTLYNTVDSSFIASDSIVFDCPDLTGISGWSVKSNLDNVIVFTIDAIDVRSTLKNPGISEKTKMKLREVLDGESPQDINAILEFCYLKE